MIWQLRARPTSAADPSLELVPVVADDARSSPRCSAMSGCMGSCHRATTTESCAPISTACGRPPGRQEGPPSGTGRFVAAAMAGGGQVQAAFSDQGRAARSPGRRRGLAGPRHRLRAARAVVRLARAARGGHHHRPHPPRPHASATVAARAGLRPTASTATTRHWRARWRRRVEARPPSALRQPSSSACQPPTRPGAEPVGYATALTRQGRHRSPPSSGVRQRPPRPCLTRFYTPDGTVASPDTVPSAEFWTVIYSDQALVTHVDERGAPASRAPSRRWSPRCGALELAPGMRVLRSRRHRLQRRPLAPSTPRGVTMDTTSKGAEAREALGRLGLTASHGGPRRRLRRVVGRWDLRSDHRHLRVCRAIATVAVARPPVGWRWSQSPTAAHIRSWPPGGRDRWHGAGWCCGPTS